MSYPIHKTEPRYAVLMTIEQVPIAEMTRESQEECTMAFKIGKIKAFLVGIYKDKDYANLRAEETRKEFNVPDKIVQVCVSDMELEI